MLQLLFLTTHKSPWTICKSLRVGISLCTYLFCIQKLSKLLYFKVLFDCLDLKFSIGNHITYRQYFSSFSIFTLFFPSYCISQVIQSNGEQQLSWWESVLVTLVQMHGFSAVAAFSKLCKCMHQFPEGRIKGSVFKEASRRVTEQNSSMLKHREKSPHIKETCLICLIGKQINLFDLEKTIF